MPAPTPVPNDYTQPAIPSSSLRWPFCSVDLQILTKSDGWNQGGVERALEYSQISSLTHANYVALAVPYDNLTKYTNYVTDARAAGFKVYHRSHWNAWQGDNGVGNIATSTSLTRSGSTATCVTGTAHGLATGDTVSMNGMNETEYRGEFTVTVVNSTTFTYPVSGTPASPATGNIGWRFGRQTYLDHTYDFIVANPSLFQAGDMFALCVEAQEADAQSMTFKTPGTTTFDYSLYNQFLIDQVRYANWAFQHIAGLEGKIHTWPISFGLSNLNLNGQTINVGGSVSTGNSSGLSNADIATYFANRLTIDHYIDSTISDAVTYGTDYNNDLNAIATAFPCVSSAGGGLMIGEWGFHTQTDYGDQVQYDAYTQVAQKLESKSYVLGVNFWNHLGQTQSSLWTDNSGTIVLGGRQAVGAVNTAFTAIGSMSTLQDDFEFGGIDSGKWTATNSQVLIGTSLDLEISSLLAGNYISLNSIATYDLTASSIFIQVTSVGNQTITSWEVYPIYLIADANNKVFIRIATNTVQPQKVVAGATSNVGAGIAYNAATMKWFRIRESGGTIFFEYASDPTGSWTTISSVANPITITALTVEVLCGTWQAEASTTTAKFDNINVTPGQYQFSWKGYTWNKRIHAGPPANNQTWSASNISGPDGSGYLTLALSNVGSAPIGCEIFSAKRGLGYGTYTMVVGTRLDNIDAAACFGGMFTFDFTAPPDYREIDVNETRDYGQQVTKNLLHSHTWNNGGSNTFITDSVNYNSSIVQTHRMIWTPVKITFDAFIGTGTAGTNYAHHEQTTHIPTPGLERVHFNTFVDVGITGFATVAPLNVVIRDFSFTPLGGHIYQGLSLDLSLII